MELSRMGINLYVLNVIQVILIHFPVLLFVTFVSEASSVWADILIVVNVFLESFPILWRLLNVSIALRDITHCKVLHFVRFVIPEGILQISTLLNVPFV
jgi:hypothetical protein